jgi:hypothetical protein
MEPHSGAYYYKVSYGWTNAHTITARFEFNNTQIRFRRDAFGRFNNAYLFLSVSGANNGRNWEVVDFGLMAGGNHLGFTGPSAGLYAFYLQSAPGIFQNFWVDPWVRFPATLRTTSPTNLSEIPLTTDRTSFIDLWFTGHVDISLGVGARTIYAELTTSGGLWSYIELPGNNGIHFNRSDPHGNSLTFMQGMSLVAPYNDVNFTQLTSGANFRNVTFSNSRLIRPRSHLSLEDMTMQFNNLDHNTHYVLLFNRNNVTVNNPNGARATVSINY